MSDEKYAQILATVTALEEAVMGICASIPVDRRLALLTRMENLKMLASQSVFGKSLREAADRIARGVASLDE